MAELIKNQTDSIRTFEMCIDVTGPLYGTIEEWPANIQDAIYAALARKSIEVELPLVVINSACQIDYGDDASGDRYYIRVIASEIVAKHVDPQTDQAMRELVTDILTGKRIH